MKLTFCVQGSNMYTILDINVSSVKEEVSVILY